MKARDLIIARRPFDPVWEEKYNDKFKGIFTRYLKEKREETVAAFYSASPSGQNFGLAIMEENPEEYKQEILHLSKFGSSFIRNRLLEILYRQKNWEDDIIALLSSEKRDIRALGEVVWMRWQSEGADYAGMKEEGFSGKGYLVDCEDSMQTNKLVAACADVNKSIETVVIPQQIDGKTVTEIEDYAFSDCESLTTITTSAGSYAEEWAKQEGYSVQII